MQRGENENGVAWAAKLCAMIPEKWHLIPKPEHYPADEWAANEWARECITDGDVVLHVRGFQWNRSGKMTVKVANPTTGWRGDVRKAERDAWTAESYSKLWTMGIHFSPSRTVAQAWAEIDRRLLPDARHMMAAVRARVVALEAEDAQRAAGVERIVGAAGGDWEVNSGENQRGHHVLNVSGPERENFHPYGHVDVYSASVNLELRNLTHDQAAAVFVALRRHECERVLGAVWDSIREAGADPREEFAAESAK